ncbi:hypothetical protein B0T17DRAFT_611390 [Bombardia bombarda]|uniref:Uncharacterized protein n=1 Tax=Bombardia bombarda TaxID=252184 RepID=A0AA39XJU1_9PEZI|nr:hypothetical protein B0T17DRAFT_611390 [Bombardia bombarda]
MASSWLLLYPLMVTALVGIAIYEHINTTTLSLPIAPALTILTILLPLIATANAISLPYLAAAATHHQIKQTSSTGSATTTTALQRLPLLPATLQALQLILTTILATLFLSDLLPSPIRACLLERRWSALWQSHDATAIRRIQDALDCCGFRSVKHMAWPFPQGSNPGEQVDCATRYGRTEACAVPWERAMKGAAGGDFGVVVAVVVMQVVGLLVVRMFGSSSSSSGSARGGGVWRRLFEGGGIFTPRGGDGGRGDARARPLLGAPVVEEEEEENGEESGGHDAYMDRDGASRRGTNGYGSTGPRVEPSHQSQGPWAD